MTGNMRPVRASTPEEAVSPPPLGPASQDTTRGIPPEKDLDDPGEEIFSEEILYGDKRLVGWPWDQFH